MDYAGDKSALEAVMDIFATVPTDLRPEHCQPPVRRQAAESEFVYRSAAVAVPRSPCTLRDPRFAASECNFSMSDCSEQKRGGVTTPSSGSTSTPTLSTTHCPERFTRMCSVTLLSDSRGEVQFGAHKITRFTSPPERTHFQCSGPKGRDLAHVVHRILATLTELHCATFVDADTGEIKLSTILFFGRVAATIRVFEAAPSKPLIVAFSYVSGDQIAATRLFIDIANHSQLCRAVPVPFLLRETLVHSHCEGNNNSNGKRPGPTTVWVDLACSDTLEESSIGARALASESCTKNPCFRPASYLPHLKELLPTLNIRICQALDAHQAKPKASRGSFADAAAFDRDRDTAASLCAAVGDIANAAAAQGRLTESHATSIADAIGDCLLRCLSDQTFDVTGKRFYLKTLGQLCAAHSVLLRKLTGASEEGRGSLIALLQKYETEEGGISSTAASVARAAIEAASTK